MIDDGSARQTRNMPPILSKRHIDSRSIGSNSVTPSRGVMGIVLKLIVSLVALQPVMEHIITFCNWAINKDVKNTYLAQIEVNTDYLNRQQELWEEKVQKARTSFLERLAVEKPALFMKEFIDGKEKGSEDWQFFVRLLQKQNPGFFEVHQRLWEGSSAETRLA